MTAGRGGKILVLFFLGIFLLSQAVAIARLTQEGAKPGEVKKEKEKPRKLVPEFKNIKERVAVYAFLAWMWLVIGVLLYMLGEKIKETDRLRRMKF